MSTITDNKEKRAIPYVLTPEQRELAHKRAAEMRSARRILLEDVGKGQVPLSEVFTRVASQDEVAGGIRVYTLLRSLPGYGKVRSTEVLYDLGIPDNRKLRGLGVRQRERLLERIS